jgi:FLVCR family feline leukemia virus subgroup C receptor-related protein
MSEEQDLSSMKMRPKAPSGPDPWRWYILLLFSMSSFINALAWITMAPMTTVLMGVYDESWFGIHFMSNIYLGAFIPLSFPCSYMIDKKGLKFSLIVSIVLSATGLGLKLLIA